MEPTDEELMEAYARRGERGAFDQLFRRHAGRLHGFFVRSTGRDDLAADFVQQTFLHVHRARADFRAGAPFRPWLYAVMPIARWHGSGPLPTPNGNSSTLLCCVYRAI